MTKGKKSKSEERKPRQTLDPNVFLTYQEIQACEKCFKRFDADKSGSIDTWELNESLKAMGKTLSHSQLLEIVTEFDADGSGAIELNEFLSIVTWLKMKDTTPRDSETMSIFESLGGGPGTRGHVRGDLLIKLCRELGLTIEIADLVAQVDTDGSGQIEYEEFASLMRCDEKGGLSRVFEGESDDSGDDDGSKVEMETKTDFSEEEREKGPK